MFVHEGLPRRLLFPWYDDPTVSLLPSRSDAPKFHDPTLDWALVIARLLLLIFPFDDELAWPIANEFELTFDWPPNDGWFKLNAFELDEDNPDKPAENELDWLVDKLDLRNWSRKILI